MASQSPASRVAADSFPAAVRSSTLSTRTAAALGPHGLVLRLLTEAAESIHRDRSLAHGTLARAVALLDAERAAPAPHHLGGLVPWQANKVAAYIENHLKGGAPVAELAVIARLSRSHFSRAFKATFGMSPTQYTLCRRIAQARRLLIETHQPLCEVALVCGFADQAHLSRTFRRFVGQSPNRWRRAYRPDPDAPASPHRGAAPAGHILQ